jgi:predicted metal-dependent enzyme (double-stranded beta helix superfamily)
VLVFYDAISTILSSNELIQNKIIKLRDLLRQCLCDSNFLLSCVESVLDTLDQSMHAGTEWIAPPLFYHQQLKYSVRVIFWPGNYENSPHQHKTWSVTGVLHNKLDFSIYELKSGESSLRKVKSFSASDGEVGYLVPGCIHQVGNSSGEVSASLHIFNNIDIAKPEDNAIWYYPPKQIDLKQGLIERALLACSKIVSMNSSKRSEAILGRISEQSRHHVFV